MIRRIAYVVRTFPRLSQTFVTRELDWLLANGFECRIFCLNRSDEAVTQAAARSPWILARLHHLDQASEAILAGFSPDIIHAHFATDAALAALDLGHRHRVPVTFTAHGYDIYRDPPEDFARRAERAAFVVTVSEANRRHLVERLGVRREKIKLVPNGIDTDFFAPDPGQPKPGISHIVCVARLEPVKQLHLLLAGCGVLRDADVPFRCTIVGEGSCRDTLLTLRQELGLTDHVTFAGPLESERVRHHLRSAHLAVLSSQSEGHPVSLLEAAAVGIPAVAPAVGGIPEIIVHGETGLMTDSADPRALGMAMARVCTDHVLAGSMGTAARQRALRHFSTDRQLGALVEVWEAARRAWDSGGPEAACDPIEDRRERGTG